MNPKRTLLISIAGIWTIALFSLVLPQPWKFLAQLAMIAIGLNQIIHHAKRHPKN